MLCNQYCSKRGLVLVICITAFIILIASVRNIMQDSILKLDSCMEGINRNLSLQGGPKLKEDFRFNRSDFDKSKSFITMYNMEQENNGHFRCVSMNVVPPTKVCLHHVSMDAHVSASILRKGSWEPHILSEVKAELMKDSELGLLDIGANIGVYTLYAATFGRKVMAVEPYESNLLRLHKAAVLGGLTKNIMLIQNAVSDKRAVAVLKLSKDNQGDTRVLMQSKPCTIEPCRRTIKTILLSDLRYVAPFQKAILKIDIQGYEHLAFSTIEPLLDTISIPAMFMEWEMVQEMQGADYEAVKKMLNVLHKRGYLPYRLKTEGGTTLNRSAHRKWPINVIWRRNTTATSVH